MTARPRKTTPAAAAPADLASKRPAAAKRAPAKKAPARADREEPTAYEAMRAEVEAEPVTDEELEEGTVVVPLTTRNGTGDIAIPPAHLWSSKAHDFIADGRIQRWAELTLSDDDMDTWEDLDPTITDASDFMYAWMDEAGYDPGKSRRLRRSSRSLRRR